ncbi:threonine/serine dehydratase [Herbaspirillum sp. alder98]|uniref:threonine/serine dehydratase n=1 Tax=Herbaspirillum sp. alder98 TaxID=2913096 RepID=UPI001CD83022|nr:threonine/serine dehydratase [Herbaspirillum sp. alder98]MCA1326744.1 threonine/serine dehydratase [Herbaspirillum sp. alder98]
MLQSPPQVALTAQHFEEIGAPSIDAIAAAAKRIAPYASNTPLLESPAINALTGARVLFKAEVLQQAGSFKFRGACNRLLQLSAAQKAAGVVAFSSGNHALAISTVARMLDIAATILMPSDAPRTKIEGARRNGATVRLYDRKTEDREAIGAEIAGASGAVIVPPYDDPFIMTGQATVGLETVEAARAGGVTLDAVLAACSGGGLVAGVASAVRALSPATRVYAVEPAEFNELQRSLASGQPEKNPPDARSICDALQVASPGKLTFPVNRALLAGSLSVTDDEVRHAMRVAFEHLKLVVEPGGAVGLAAVLAGKFDLAGKTIAVVLSGGNVDADMFAGVIHP